MKKLIALLLVLLLAAAVPAMADAPAIKRVEYEGLGRVEVDFYLDVEYENLQLEVKDSEGTVYAAEIRERDEDDLDFYVKNIEPGKTYNFTLSGLRSGWGGAFESVSGSFDVPEAGAVAIRKLDYDADDRELEIDFAGKVQYENLHVQVSDSSGQNYAVTIRETDRDSVEVRVSGLERGGQYSVTVSGVRADESAAFGSVTGSFTAR